MTRCLAQIMRVAQEYINLLWHGAIDTLATTQSILNSLAGGGNLSPCVQSNISKCPPTQTLSTTTPVNVLVYNSLSWKRTEIVQVPVPTANVQVIDTLQELRECNH